MTNHNPKLVGTAVQRIGPYSVVLSQHGSNGQTMAEAFHDGVPLGAHVRDSAFEATLEAGFTISQHVNKENQK